MKLKLAILAQAYLFDETSNINGTLVQLYNLTQGFNKQGVTVYYIATTKDVSKPKYSIEDGVHFYWIQAKSGVLGWKKVMIEYQNLLEELQPNAVYVRGRNVMQYVAGKFAKKNSIPYVWGTNGDDSAELWKNIRRLKNTNKSLLKKIALLPFKALEDIYINKGMKMPNYIVNQNTHQKEETAKLLNREGIILNSYYSQSKNMITPDRNQVLWLARWSKEKQPELFINMVSKLQQQNVNFVMAGSSSNLNSNKLLIKNANSVNIKTPGNIVYKEVTDYFAKSLIFVNTSYREGVSNTFIEAMLNGVPVLSLNSNPNNWLTDFNIGYCANGDLEALTSALNHLLSNREDLKIMSENAKAFAEQQFSNPKIIESYLSLFQNNEKRQ